MERVLEEEDLGFIISNNLSWDSHVMHIVLKTNRMLGLLKRTCPLITDVKVRRTLYLTLAKSQLSYATDVWSPGSFKLRMILERVQRRASRSILRTKIGEVLQTMIADSSTTSTYMIGKLEILYSFLIAFLDLLT